MSTTAVFLSLAVCFSAVGALLANLSCCLAHRRINELEDKLKRNGIE